MNKYVELTIGELSQETMELLIARLSDIGYDGFLEEGQTLKAYINESGFDQVAVDQLKTETAFNYSATMIREENWNAIWEASFEPVVVDDYVAVRADFHDVVKGVQYEIVITPKMSFGTGHHATTYLMMQEMRLWNWEGKDVLDFGTGTGILAILAAKSGAAYVLGIDNDPWSIDNAAENLQRNQVKNTELMLSGEIPQQKNFDLILANINKHILSAQAPLLINALKKDGVLIISGILAEDRQHMELAFSLINKPVHISEKNNWLLMSFKK